MSLFPLRSVLSLALLFSLAGCTGEDDGKPDETGDVPADEVCDNTVDDDEDGDADCADSDCSDDPACQEPGTENNCADGLDDDGDGAIDCDDSDCDDDTLCDTTTETRCADGADDDGDGAIDCDDTDCAADQACAEPVESICDDTTDNDGDGATDCDDTDCAADAACVEPASETICDDTLDDDGDGAIDCDDDDCAGDVACAMPTTEENCEDGLDDDGDRDFDCDDSDCADDPACEIVIVPEFETSCEDGIDEDEDGATDCDDSDCAEAESCEGALELYCEDAVDDDGDGATDCDDSDCDGIYPCMPSVCDETDLGAVLGDSIATGSTDGAGDDHEPSCGWVGAPEVTFSWTAPAEGTFRATTLGTAWDTTLTVLHAACADEVDCDDDGGEGSDSVVEFAAAEGEVFSIALGGYNDDDYGDFVLNMYAVTELSCEDGTDEDGDGLTDCEDDDCADEIYCNPEATCEGGEDEDRDGAIDCDDSDCDDDLVCTHPCVDSDLGSVVGEAVVTASTAGESDDFAPSCSEGSSAPDLAYLWTAPADGSYTFSTAGSGFDTVLTLETPDCSDTELECHDSVDGEDTSSEVTRAMTVGEAVVVAIDGASDGSGEFQLAISADLEVVCDDGNDEDHDGYTDCDDTDCLAAPACNPETVCDNVLDEDLDDETDCMDEDCAEDAACDTSRADFELGYATGAAVATGSTVGMMNDTIPLCRDTSTAEDVMYAWVAPSTGDWTFDLDGSSYDTVMSLIAVDGGELQCNDDYIGLDSGFTATLNAGTLVFINIDGYSSSTGDYVLNINPVIAE